MIDTHNLHKLFMNTICDDVWNGREDELPRAFKPNLGATIRKPFQGGNAIVDGLDDALSSRRIGLLDMSADPLEIISRFWRPADFDQDLKSLSIRAANFRVFNILPSIERGYTLFYSVK